MTYPVFSLRLFCCLLACVVFAGCNDLATVEPGRGVALERGPMVKVYPKGDEPLMDRHGMWQGLEGDRVVWEVRYTRGVPTGPYREWNEEGEMIATWPYNWEGQIEGWARWYENGEPGFKMELTTDQEFDLDPIGKAVEFRELLKIVDL